MSVLLVIGAIIQTVLSQGMYSVFTDGEYDIKNAWFISINLGGVGM